MFKVNQAFQIDQHIHFFLMSKIIRFNTKLGPPLIGPYSTASIYNNTVHISAQMGLNPQTGSISPDVQQQTQQTLQNIKLIMGELRVSMDDTIKATIYLKNMGDFGKVNEIYSKYFEQNNYPSRVAIAVGEMPRGALVGIQVLAAIDSDKLI